jgi:glycosyltransferase involved in cell wall biosynthesis
VSKETAAIFNQAKYKTEVIYNGIEVSNLIQKSNLLKETYALPATDTLIGVVGILEDWKNQEDLIYAAKQIIKVEKLPAKFFIVGDSLYHQRRRQKYKEQLQKLQREFKLEKEVIFTGFRKDVKKIISSLDILVICSKEPDPCPMVSLEAGSQGLAVISSDLGGVKEMFKEDIEVLFYSPGNPKELSNKLTQLINNHNAVHKLGEALRLRIVKDYNFDIFINKINRIITENIK